MGKKLKTYADYKLNENMQSFLFHVDYFKQILRSSFVWENLPCEMPQRYIEKMLYYHGCIGFFKSKKLGFLVASKVTAVGKNAYDEPTQFIATLGNGLTEVVEPCDIVIVYNNTLRQPSIKFVNYFAKRLETVDNTIEINLENLKIPFCVSCPEGQKETVKEMFRKRERGEPFILLTEDFATHNQRVDFFKPEIPNLSTQLLDSKDRIRNEALTFFGINNCNVSKRERLVTGEVEQNNEQIEIVKLGMLEERQKAVENINEKFGTNIQVRMLYDETKVGDNREQLYNDSIPT